MAVLPSDGLCLQVGHGTTPEVFAVLAGVELKRLEIRQTLLDNTDIQQDAWVVGAATVTRRLTLECQAMATDMVSANRIRSLAMGGSSGNFVLALNDTENLFFAAFVVNYREILQAGSVKRLQFQLDSTGAVGFA
jgi:hypothetical protein